MDDRMDDEQMDGNIYLFCLDGWTGRMTGWMTGRIQGKLHFIPTFFNICNMELRKVDKHLSVTDYAQHHGHFLNDNKRFVVFLNDWEALDPGLLYPVSTFHQTGNQRHCDATYEPQFGIPAF